MAVMMRNWHSTIPTLILFTLSVPALWFGCTGPAAPTPTTTTTSTPTPTPLNIDYVLQKLQHGTIAFNTPTSMMLEETKTIHLVIGLSQTVEELRQMIAEEGPIENATIRISDTMEAVLSSPDDSFKINPVTPEKQDISALDVNEWKWDVTALKPGNQKLHLAINACINEVPHTLKVFDRVIEVNVSWTQRLSSFWESNLKWLLGLILVPVGGWLWRRYH